MEIFCKLKTLRSYRLDGGYLSVSWSQPTADVFNRRRPSESEFLFFLFLSAVFPLREWQFGSMKIWWGLHIPPSSWAAIRGHKASSSSWRHVACRWQPFRPRHKIWIISHLLSINAPGRVRSVPGQQLLPLLLRMKQRCLFSSSLFLAGWINYDICQLANRLVVSQSVSQSVCCSWWNYTSWPFPQIQSTRCKDKHPKLLDSNS